MHPLRRPLLKRPPRLSAGGTLAFFVDLDGTLVDIADTPSQCHRCRPARPCWRACAMPAAARWRWSAAAPSPISMPIWRRCNCPLAGQHGLERRDGRPDAPDAWPRAPAARQGRRWRSPAAASRSAAGGQGHDAGHPLPAGARLAPWLHRMLRADRHQPNEFSCSGQAGDRNAPGRGRQGYAAIAEFCAEAPFRGRRPVFIGDDLTDEHGFADGQSPRRHLDQGRRWRHGGRPSPARRGGGVKLAGDTGGG
jgi:trehalose 6-phosphate phosphatase